MPPWRTLTSRYVLKSPWINVRADALLDGLGRTIDPFYVVEYPDWACVIPLTDEGTIIMVEQYRHGIGQMSLELPAGILEPNEAPTAGARRELLEETGYSAESFVALGRCAPDPSKHTNYAHIFLATGLLKSGEQDLDETEIIRAVEIHVSDIDRLIADGRIIHGIHLYALTLARARGHLH